MRWRRGRSFFDEFFEEMERMFEDVFGRDREFFSFRYAPGRGRRYVEASDEFRDYREALTDVWEDDNEVVVTMELPGVKKEDIKINVTPRTLEVRAEQKEESKDEKEGTVRIERAYKGFYKVVDLPVEVKTDNVKATYNNGVLEIRLPKAHKEEKKEVKVE